MNDERPIQDIARYNKGMRQSLIDKTYFLDKVDAEVFVDFGCADGVLLQYMNNLFPENHYIGYDFNRQMLDQAAKILPETTRLCDSLKSVKETLKTEFAGKKSCLILSSVIHEVYSYSNPQQFWDDIFELEFDFISIRDMCVSNTCSRPSDPITVARVHQIFDADLIADWESSWGSLDENWSLTHFFLTYRYTDNWARESRENYLPITKEKLLQLIPNCYYPHFIEHYTLPFLRGQVYKDFQIQLHERTHLKLIIRKSTEEAQTNES